MTRCLCDEDVHLERLKDQKDESGFSKITFQPETKHLSIKLGSSILEGIRQISIDIQAPCGDLGLCGRCRVIILNGKEFLNVPTNKEKNNLSRTELKEGHRLACQCIISKSGKINVLIPPESRIGYQQIIIQGIMPRFKLAPIVEKINVKIKWRKPIDFEDKSEEFFSYLKTKDHSINLINVEAAKRLNEFRKDDVITTVIWDNNEVLSVYPENASKRLLGFAVDVGTTKIVGYLVDIIKRELITAVSLPNPQTLFGDDIISRITYMNNNEDKSKELQLIIIESVNRLITEACKKVGISTEEVYDMTVSGNTVMHHIFFGISTKYIAFSPFPVSIKNSFDIKARDIGLMVNPAAYVHALPPIAGFVGSDTVAGILATEIYKTKEKSMLIDIGTNAEIVVGNKDKLSCCSAPAGPAFEGVRIKFGMKASSGAIETIWIDPIDYSTGYKTIDNIKPKGICGSGLIDLIAHLHKNGIINNKGRFNKKLETSRIRTSNNEEEYVIVWKKETAINKDITITQRDIQEIILAKAAIYSGASILLHHMKILPKDIEKLYIAGSFGSYLDLNNSLLIGLYPEISVNKTYFVGNTAGSGARMALLSKKIRYTANRIAKNTEYIELATDPLFEKEFMNALWIPHREKERFPTVDKMIWKN